MKKTLTVLVTVFLAVFLFVSCEFKDPFFHSVRFDSNGGTSVEEQTVADGEKAERPDDPTCEGKVFKEWQLDGETYNFDTPVTSDITLKAVWTVRHSVRFDSNGGTSVEKQTVADGEKAERPDDPTYGKNVFMGWQLNGEAYNFDTPVTSDITLKAVWTKYVVSFDSDGGSAVDYECILEGGKAIKPAEPTKEGYTFLGWYSGSTKFDFDTVITSNMCLLAVWQENTAPVYHTVTFDSDGGTEYESQSVLEKEIAYNPGTPAKDGYSFVGWYNGDVKYDFSSKVTGDITLKAKWGYTVSFDAYNGQTMYNQAVIVVKGGTIAADEVSTPTKDGYAFDKWVTQSGSEFKLGVTRVTSDLKLTAVWKEVYRCYIDYNTSDTKYTNTSREYAAGDKFSFSDAAWNIDDESFRGWIYNGEYYLKTQAKWSNEITVENNSCVTALWDGYDVKVTFTDTDGTTVLLVKEVKAGSSIDLGDWVPEKDGYEFGGWVDSKGYGFDARNASGFSTDDTFHVKKWNELHTVTFKADDETYLVQKVADGKTADFSFDKPTKKGYTCTDWYETSEDKTFNQGSGITGDLTLNAKWTPVTYTVIFSQDGTSLTGLISKVQEGAVVNEADATDFYGKSISKLTPDDEEEKKFNWYYAGFGDVKDIEAGNITPLKFEFGTTAITENTIVIGKWTYQVKFDVTGAVENTTVDSQWVLDGDTVQKPADPTSSFTGDYLLKTFAYWSLEKNGAEYDFSTPVEEPITLYAVWRDLKVGDRGPAGGYIFYDRGEVQYGEWRYYEAAPVNQISRYTSADNLSGVPSTSVEVGQGRTNTLNLLNPTLSTQYSAAIACINYTVTNNGKLYVGWFLPSRDELSLMCYNLATKNLGSWPRDKEYLSSTAIPGSSRMVYGMNFTYCSTATLVCYRNYYVRPMKEYPNSRDYEWEELLKNNQ